MAAEGPTRPPSPHNGDGGDGQRRLRVLVVDDHDVVHWGFRLMLGQLPWVQRCRGARTGSEALAICRDFEPHVALVDLLLGGRVRPGAVRAAARAAPAPRVLLMSGAGGISPARGARRGRRGLHLQGLAARRHRQAVRMVGDGGEVFQPHAATRRRRRSPRASARSSA